MLLCSARGQSVTARGPSVTGDIILLAGLILHCLSRVAAELDL